MQLLPEAGTRGAGATQAAGCWPDHIPGSVAPLPSAVRGSLELIYRNSRFNLRWARRPCAAQSTGSACPAAAASRAHQMSTFVPNKRVIVSAKLPSHCLWNLKRTSSTFVWCEAGGEGRSGERGLGPVCAAWSPGGACLHPLAGRRSSCGLRSARVDQVSGVAVRCKPLQNKQTKKFPQNTGMQQPRAKPGWVLGSFKIALNYLLKRLKE